MGDQLPMPYPRGYYGTYWRKAQSDKQEPAAMGDEMAPWREGYNAVMDGKEVGDCPYPEDSREAALWELGVASAWEDGCHGHDTEK